MTEANFVLRHDSRMNQVLALDGQLLTEEQIEALRKVDATAELLRRIPLGSLPKVWPSTAEAMIRELEPAFGLEVSKVLPALWNKLRDIEKYKHGPVKSGVVQLYDRTIVSKHEPSVKVTLGEFSTQIYFQVRFELKLTSAVLTIRDARI